LTDFSHCKLSELDWEILEGLEAVLRVSRLLDLGQALIALAGFSRFSAKYVDRDNANLIVCHRHFRDVHDRVGKTRFTTHRSQALDQNRLAVGD
jgi:hypothetical protein